MRYSWLILFFPVLTKATTNPEVCLFEDADYKGIKQCLASASTKVWSAQDYFNNKISSIRVPKGLQVKIYANQYDDWPFFTLTEDMDLRQLSILNMQDNISRVTVLDDMLISCIRWCVIRKNLMISLAQTYGTSWNDINTSNKQILFEFARASTQHYTITLTPHIRIEVDHSIATLINKEQRIKYPLDKEAIHFSFLYAEGEAMGMRQIQFIESRDTIYFRFSPIFELWGQQNEWESELTIDNHHPDDPMLLVNLTLAASNEPVRSYRSLGLGEIICFLDPIMALYNYIVQGQCDDGNQHTSTFKKYINKDKIDSLYPNTKSLEPSFLTTEFLSLKKNPTFTLERLSSRHNMPPLSIYGAARTCKVPSSYVMSTRKKQEISKNDCIYWTLDTITFYTMLFGGGTDNTWNTEHFGQVIDNILTAGNTGYAVSDPLLEEQLITAVQQQADEAGDAGQQSKQAFNYTQQAYADYIIYNNDSNQSKPTLPATPQQIQTNYALGTYRLNVGEYVSDAIVPRIFTHGQWVEHPEQQFDVEVVRTTRPQVPQILTDMIRRWEQGYTAHQSQLDTRLTLAIEDIIKYIKMELALPDDPFWGEDLYLIVRLKGSNEPLSFLSASIGTHRIVIRESLSAPQNIIAPYAEGAVRGAGTFAVAYLAQYAQENGIEDIVSEVISQPSARVKKKIGFRLTDDL